MALAAILAVSPKPGTAAEASGRKAPTKMLEADLAGSPATTAKAENEELQRCIGESACPVYFVGALGGVFPLPTRYRLVTQLASQLNRLTFTSDVWRELHPALPALDRLSGTITVGMAADLQKISAKPLASAVVVNRNCGSEILEIPDPKPSRAPSRRMYVILREEHYVLVHDDNPDLASLLLQGFCKVDGKRRGN